MPSEVKLTGFSELKASLTAAGASAPQALASAMVVEMLAVIRKATTYVPANTGNLKGSGTVLPPEISGTRVTVTGGFGNAATAYAVWVHEGRRPGSRMPPPDAIKQWLHDKGGDEKMAFVVARSIGRRGIKPTKFLERAFLEQIPGMEQRLAAGVVRAMGRFGGGGG